MKIAFAGRAGTGKTTRSQILEQLYPGVLRTSFAAPLKAEVARRHGITAVELEDRKAEFRAELQAEGDRNHHRWLASMNERLGEALSPRPGGLGFKAAVIDDVRYQDEVDLLHVYGFYVVRLQAPKKTLQERYRAKHGRAMTKEEWSDPSEVQIGKLTVDTVWDATADPHEQVRSWLLAASIAGLRDVFGTLGRLFGDPVAIR